MPELDYYIIYTAYNRSYPCTNFGWCPSEDDPRPTQMWYPVSHGTACPGHRQYVLWDSIRANYPVAWPRVSGNYWIRLSDEWKDAL